MDSIATSLRSRLDCDRVHGRLREALATQVLGRVLGYSLPIPTSPVSDLWEHFETTHLPELNRQICKANELEVLNIPLVQQLAKECFAFRYRMVHDGAHPAVMDLCSHLMNEGSFEVAPQFLQPMADPTNRRMINDHVACIIERIKELNKAP